MVAVPTSNTCMMCGALSGAEGGDAGIHGVGIAALVGRDDLVVLLGRIEVVGELDDQIVVGAGHGVPPLDLRLRRGIAGRKQHGAGSEPAQADRISHKSSSSLGASASSDGRFLQPSHDNGVSVGQRHGRQGSPTGRVHGRAHIPGRRSLAAGTAGRILSRENGGVAGVRPLAQTSDFRCHRSGEGSDPLWRTPWPSRARCWRSIRAPRRAAPSCSAPIWASWASRSASSPSTIRPRAGWSTIPRTSGARRSRPPGRRWPPPSWAPATSPPSASPTSARPAWSGTGARASPSTAPSCGRTGARRRRAAPSSAPATSRPSPPRPACCSIPISPPPRSPGCSTTWRARGRSPRRATWPSAPSTAS